MGISNTTCRKGSGDFNIKSSRSSYKTSTFAKRSLKAVFTTFFIACTLFSYQLSAQCDPTRDSLTLADFFTSMNGYNWRNNDGWLVRDIPISEWHGIEVNDSGCVQKLIMPLNAIAGDLPESFGWLSELTHLDLSSSAILSLPPTLGGLKKLTDVRLVNIALPVIHESIGELVALKTLSITGLFSDLPDRFTKLENLEELFLKGQNFSTLPDSFGNLSKLKILDLARNELSELPLSFSRLTDLRELNLARNQLTLIPDYFSEFKRLKNFDFNGNTIELLPDFFGTLDSLEVVDLSECSIQEIADEALALPAMIHLDLSENNIVTLPSSIGSMTRLESFHLLGNEIESLPEAIGQLSALREIDLERNQLSSLPVSFGNLTGLEILRLSHNNISDLPNYFSELDHLKTLTLGSNKLRNLPDGLSTLPDLEVLEIWFNELSFEDLYPIKTLIDSSSDVHVVYQIQSFPYADTSLCANFGKAVTFDLKIDSGISSNVYTWFKDRNFYTEIIGDNALSFIPTNLSDQGRYYVRISNEDFPEFWLYSTDFHLYLAKPGSACLPTRDDPGFLVSQNFYPGDPGGINEEYGIQETEKGLRLSSRKMYSDLAESFTILCYPTPATTEVICSCKGLAKIEDLSVHNLQGQRINVGYQYTANGIEIDTENLSPGLYILGIMTSNGRSSSRILIGAE